MRPLRESLRGAIVALAALQGMACDEPPRLDVALPPGALVAGEAAALDAVLARIEPMAGTPIAKRAALLRGSLRGCTTFYAHSASGDLDALLDDLACREAPLDPALERLRGGADVVVLMPIGSDRDGGAAPRLVGAFRVAPDGSLALDARVSPLPSSGGLRIGIPHDEPPGESPLNTESLLVHLRLRPADGLDLAALVAEGGQGDDLFRLKSDLFAGALLAGDLEAVVYLPDAGHLIPPMAVAVGITMKAAAVAAMDRFVEALEARWPIHAEPARFGRDPVHEGRCIVDLRILPEFAPCYAATDDHLVVGWNPPSVARALSAGKGTSLDARGGLFVALARLAEADRRLHEIVAPDLPPLALDYAWESLRIVGEPESDAVRVRIELAAGPT